MADWNVVPLQFLGLSRCDDIDTQTFKPRGMKFDYLILLVCRMENSNDKVSALQENNNVVRNIKLSPYDFMIWIFLWSWV